MPPARIEPVDEGRWGDLETLFEARGGPHYCWCMLWRTMASKPRGDASAKKAARKAALRKQVENGVAIGLLAYVNDKPVAWCSVGPRPSFRRLVENEESSENVWSIVCFFVSRKHRHRGLPAELIEAAALYAKANGADLIEAYPVEKTSPSYRFMGVIEQFEGCGFSMVGKVGTRRHVMRRRLH